MPSSPPITGGCGCGAVRFALSQPPTMAAYCHCTRCQRRSGTAASASARIQPGSLTVTAGDDALAHWSVDGGFDKVFCRACGSAVFTVDPETGDVAAVRLGAFDGDPGVRPSARQFTAYAAAWEPIPDDGLPRFEERMPR